MRGMLAQTDQVPARYFTRPPLEALKSARPAVRLGSPVLSRPLPSSRLLQVTTARHKRHATSV